jgi:hypothetical protein
MSMLVPQMSETDEFFFCDIAEQKVEHSLAFCENCKLLVNDRCTEGKELREIVVRLG